METALQTSSPTFILPLPHDLQAAPPSGSDSDSQPDELPSKQPKMTLNIRFGEDEDENDGADARGPGKEEEGDEGKRRERRRRSNQSAPPSRGRSLPPAAVPLEGRGNAEEGESGSGALFK